MGRLTESSRHKAFVGYSDAGMLLAALYRGGFEAVAHGPVAQDVLRDGGEAAVGRALDWMVDRAPEALEPTVGRARKTAAFNITVLSQLLGTPLQPDLDGHVLMLEEVGEAMYRIDRSLFHITSNAGIRRVSGLMLGRCSAITPNEPDFGMSEEEIARYWCRRSGIPWLGRADIGHDANNKIVPFGSLRRASPRRRRRHATGAACADNGARQMTNVTSWRVMLRRLGETERKAVEIESLESRPRYGETLTLLIEGKQVRAKVIGVWQHPPWPASGIYMINADEIE
jgi:hypothetical protein